MFKILVRISSMFVKKFQEHYNTQLHKHHRHWFVGLLHGNNLYSVFQTNKNMVFLCGRLVGGRHICLSIEIYFLPARRHSSVYTCNIYNRNIASGSILCFYLHTPPFTNLCTIYNHLLFLQGVLWKTVIRHLYDVDVWFKPIGLCRVRSYCTYQI